MMHVNEAKRLVHGSYFRPGTPRVSEFCLSARIIHLYYKEVE